MKASGELLSAKILSQPITGDDAMVLLKALPVAPGQSKSAYVIVIY